MKGRGGRIWTWIVTVVAAASLGGAVPGLLAQEEGQKKPTETGLVRVNIRTESKSHSEAIEINGRRIPGYRPAVIRTFPATGVVIDDQSHVLTFLGYRWVDVQGTSTKVNVETLQGERFEASLIGIDQILGVALIAAPGASLKKTSFCVPCDMKIGAPVLSPEMSSASSDASRFHLSRVLSVRNSSGVGAAGEWVVTISRPLAGIGEPLLDGAQRVIGFVADQGPAAASAGIRAVVYPMSQLLNSASRILKAGGDIRTGWLGVYLDDAKPMPGPGILVRKVELDSPAARAGLQSDDIIVRWMGRDVREVREFIKTVQNTPLGSRVTIDAIRQGKPVSLAAVIEARNVREPGGRVVFDVPQAAEPPPQRVARDGLDTVPLPPQLAEFLGVSGQSGLLVLNVDPGGPYEKAGLSAGDIILSVDSRPIRDPREFVSYIGARQAGTRVFLKVVRKGSERGLTVEIP